MTNTATTATANCRDCGRRMLTNDMLQDGLESWFCSPCHADAVRNLTDLTGPEYEANGKLEFVPTESTSDGEGFELTPVNTDNVRAARGDVTTADHAFQDGYLDALAAHTDHAHLYPLNMADYQAGRRMVTRIVRVQA